MSAGVATAGDVKKNELDALVGELGAITSEAREVFGALDAAQLNWKPSAERWSVGLCFDHLIKTNSTFFADMERVAAGTHKSSAWARVDLRRTMVTSPVAAVATYSLLDAYRIVVAHERKHFEQARRVTEEAGFPRA